MIFVLYPRRYMVISHLFQYASARKSKYIIYFLFGSGYHDRVHCTKDDRDIFRIIC